VSGASGERWRWPDGERTIVFGRGVREELGELLGDGYALLTTPRALNMLPSIAERAAAVHEIEPGNVDELAGTLRGVVGTELLVAFGGGRVIDVGKALAASGWAGTARVAAIPTTLSGAEMTNVHMHAAGVAFEMPRVRPVLVVNDPELCASQPFFALAQSAANALGHAVEGPLTPLGSPVTRLAALEAARLIGGCFAPGSLEASPGATPAAAQDDLALAALLAGYVIGSTWYGLHHVLSQTLRRFTGVGHGAANSLMLPVTIAALGRRNPEWMASVGAALGEEPVAFARRLRAATGITGLRQAGVTVEQLEACAEAAVSRPELALTPPAADVVELRSLYEAAM